MDSISSPNQSDYKRKWRTAIWSRNRHRFSRPSWAEVEPPHHRWDLHTAQHLTTRQISDLMNQRQYAPVCSSASNKHYDTTTRELLNSEEIQSPPGGWLQSQAKAPLPKWCKVGHGPKCLSLLISPRKKTIRSLKLICFCTQQPCHTVILPQRQLHHNKTIIIPSRPSTVCY